MTGPPSCLPGAHCGAQPIRRVPSRSRAAPWCSHSCAAAASRFCAAAHPFKFDSLSLPHSLTLALTFSLTLRFPLPNLQMTPRKVWERGVNVQDDIFERIKNLPGNDQTIVISIDGVQITREQLLTILPGERISDSVARFMFHHIARVSTQSEAQSNGENLTVCFPHGPEGTVIFSLDWCDSMLKNNRADLEKWKVGGWTRGRNLWKSPNWIIPVNRENAHYFHVVVFTRATHSQVHICDSMRYDGCEAFYEKLFKGVQKIGEASAVQEGIDVQIVRDWELYVREEHPEQDDSCNCLPATACSIHDTLTGVKTTDKADYVKRREIFAQICYEMVPDDLKDDEEREPLGFSSVCPDISVYEKPQKPVWIGSTNENGQQHGRGVLHWGSGNWSEGEFEKGKEHGPWVLNFASGAVCKGEFVDKAKHGHWVEALSNGDREEGTYDSGKKHGRWLKTRKNGSTWDAVFDHGAITKSWMVFACGGCGGSMEGGEAMSEGAILAGPAMAVTGNASLEAYLGSGGNVKPRMPESETSSSGQSGGFVRSISGESGTLGLKPAGNKTPGYERGARHKPAPTTQSLFAKPTTPVQTPGKDHSDSEQVSAYAPAKFIVAVLS